MLEWRAALFLLIGAGTARQVASFVLRRNAALERVRMAGTHRLPSPSSVFVFSSNIMLARQTSRITYLKNNRLQVEMEGRLSLPPQVIEYRVEEGNFLYTLPPLLQEKMKRLRSTFISATYSPDVDTVMVKLILPIVGEYVLEHARVIE